MLSSLVDNLRITSQQVDKLRQSINSFGSDNRFSESRKIETPSLYREIHSSPSKEDELHNIAHLAELLELKLEEKAKILKRLTPQK